MVVLWLVSANFRSPTSQTSIERARHFFGQVKTKYVFGKVKTKHFCTGKTKHFFGQVKTKHFFGQIKYFYPKN
jgi:hypothetical protein